MKLRDFIGLLDYDSMIGTDPMDMYIAIESPNEDGDIGLSYVDVIRKIPGVLLDGEIESIILPASEDETLTIMVDGVVYPTSSGMNPSSDEVEDFFTGASSKAKGRYVRATGLNKYRVFAIETSEYYLDVEAEDEDEAELIGEQADGGDFTPTDNGTWDIDRVEPI